MIKFVKIIAFVLLALTILTGGALWYASYMLGGPCRNLEDISQNEVLRASLSDDLSSYVNDAAVLMSLESRLTGSPYYLWELDQPLVIDLDEIGIGPNHARLILRTNRSDDRLHRPYVIEEVGIGTTRERIMFRRQNLNEGEDQRVVLNPVGYVECDDNSH